MGNVVIDRVAIHLTWRCTLRCEKCSAFIPKSYELGLNFDYNLDEIILSLSTLLKITDSINVVTLTGGEAILHKNIVELCQFLLENEYKFNRIDFQTNGTILFPDKLLSVLAKSNKFILFIDNYAPNISTKTKQNVRLCEKYGIKYQVRKYYGANAYMNGWIDWSPRVEKIDAETAKKQFSNCANARPGRRVFVLYGKLLTLCAMPYCRYRIGAQPIDDILLLDLSNSLSLKEKQECLVEMRDTELNPGCQYCCGLGVDQNVKRYKAGKQISNPMHQKIINLLREIKPYDEIGEDTQLINDGVLDSMSILALITLLEDSLDIEIPDDEITRERFATVDTIVELLLKLEEKANDCEP